jgi:hypothetical protein
VGPGSDGPSVIWSTLSVSPGRGDRLGPDANLTIQVHAALSGFLEGSNGLFCTDFQPVLAQVPRSSRPVAADYPGLPVQGRLTVDVMYTDGMAYRPLEADHRRSPRGRHRRVPELTGYSEHCQNRQIRVIIGCRGTTKTAGQIGGSVRAAKAHRHRSATAQQQRCLTGLMQRGDIARLNKHSPGLTSQIGRQRREAWMDRPVGARAEGPACLTVNGPSWSCTYLRHGFSGALRAWVVDWSHD